MLKYNTTNTKRTGRLTGKILKFAECMETCVGFELVVTGGSEKTRHKKGSVHYTENAVDFSKKRNSNLTRKLAEKCFCECAKGTDYYAQEEGGTQPHFHFQSVSGKGKATGFVSGVK